MDHELHDRAHKRFLEDMMQQHDVADPEPVVCAHFGCRFHLTLNDLLRGKYCLQHSIIKNESGPGGEQDPVKFVSY